MADNNKATSLDNVRQYVKGVLQGWISNKSTLDKFSEDQDGNLLFDGDEIGGNSGGSGNDYVLPKATTSTLGGIIVGDNLSIDDDGVLSATASGGIGCDDVDIDDLRAMLARVFAEWIETPVPNITLTYTGSSQTMTFDNYDSNKMTVSNDTKTGAGTYTATFTLKSGYTWKDGTSTPKNVEWTMEKADGRAVWTRGALVIGANPSIQITSSTGTTSLSTLIMDNTSSEIVPTMPGNTGFTYSCSTSNGISIDISNPTTNGTWQFAFNVGESANVKAYTTTVTVEIAL